MTNRERHQHRLTELLSLARAHQSQYLDDLAEIVAIDSGSFSPDGVNKVADWVQARLEKLGFAVDRQAPTQHNDPPLGDTLVARKRGRLDEARGGRRILLAAHMDTVFDDGAAAERPFSLDGPIAYGPGVCDDKGGLVAGLTALAILAEHAAPDYAELVFLATPDEEIGSPASRAVTEATARGMHYALGLEGARANGDLVIARKGVADYRLTVTGRPAHAGIEPERGANAALAAAHLLVAVQALNGRRDGVTVNVGVIRAGTRTNIVCAEAELLLEVRSDTVAGIKWAEQAIEDMARDPAVAGTSVRLEQTDLCPPMEDTPSARHLLTRAKATAKALGFDLGATATGGVGDANLIAGTGVPVLDGLGPVGGADHTPQEWLDTSTVAQRVTLLADLVAFLGDIGNSR
ncbi:M20 family metallopeptidase [Streptomyces sp. MBT49]|uniref:M20 family metallopeptidase n=1 Tax=Streptomyces sp. MBT49 TaxID=1488380 RepID=UPI00190E1B65|nr:M20 family metallopeptidase [Streptomyces sp. MBT49]MBK3624569.1 M20 family metallopeptidase [Streptomyces sp. MBT49]